MFDRGIEKLVNVVENVNDWRESIDVACKPLLDLKIIENRYVKAIEKCVEEEGSYFIVDNNIVIAHSKLEDGALEDGALEDGVSFLKVNNGVFFPKDFMEVKVKLIFVVASTDNTHHIDTLSKIAKLMESQEFVDSLNEATTKEKIMEIFSTSL